MNTKDAERERHMRELAARLLFKVEKHGDRFTLTRDAEVSKVVRHEKLTLEGSRRSSTPGSSAVSMVDDGARACRASRSPYRAARLRTPFADLHPAWS